MPSEPTCWCTESDEKPKDSSNGVSTNTIRNQGPQKKKACEAPRKDPVPDLVRTKTTTKPAGVRQETREEDSTASQPARVSDPECSNGKELNRHPQRQNKKEEVLKVFKCATSTSRVNRRSHLPRTRRLHPLMRAQALVDFEADGRQRQSQ